MIEKILDSLQKRLDELTDAFRGECDAEDLKIVHKVQEVEHCMEIVQEVAQEYERCNKPSCTDCEVYDKEKHYCQKWCDVIKHTVEDLKQEQGLLLFNPEELKTAIIDRMQEFADEYKQYSESSIDHFGGKAESMEVAMRIVKGAFEEALAKMGE